MLIRFGSGRDGIAEYLRTGRKQGRHYTREQLDERLVLSGDLDAVDAAIKAVSGDGDKYLHITLSFREDSLPDEALRKISEVFRKFALAAYREDEFVYYAEAHIPRLKSYLNRSTGQFVERKPHIHVVIPKVNLLTGRRLEPFGLVKNQIKWIDALQEVVNSQFGLASPKVHRRQVLTNDSDLIARHKGDLFRGPAGELKSKVLDLSLHEHVTSIDALAKSIQDAGLGEVRIRKGRDGQYLNVTPSGTAKGINLKDVVFSPAQLSKPLPERVAAVREALRIQYVQPKAAAKEIDSKQARQLREWVVYRARELKYFPSSKGPAWIEYSEADPAKKRALLSARESDFYARHAHQPQPPQEPLDVRHNPFDDNFADAFHLQSNFGVIEPKRAAESLHSVRMLPCGPVDEDSRRDQLLLPSDATEVLEQSPPDAPADQVRRVRDRTPEDHALIQRATDSLIAQLRGRLADRRRSGQDQDTAMLARARSQLDPRRVLAELTQSHGLISSKYSVAGVPGRYRIKAGNRLLSVADFLTTEMRMPWLQAKAFMLAAMHRQDAKHTPPPQLQHQPTYEMWRRWLLALPRQPHRVRPGRRQRRSAIDLNARLRLLVIAQIPFPTREAQRTAIQEVRAARAQNLRDMRAHQKEISMDPNPALTPLYLRWLHTQALEGERDALAELRRLLLPVPKRESWHFDQYLAGAGDAEPAEPPPCPKGFEPRIEANGFITFRIEGRDAVRDAGRELIVIDKSVEADDMAIALAIAKFPGVPLTVGGDDAFKSRMVAAAIRSPRVVEFDDPKLQRQLEAGRRLRSLDQATAFGPGLGPTLVPASQPVASSEPAKVSRPGVPQMRRPT